jgi:hypothetical protein
MIYKNLTDISIEDLRGLCERKVVEGKQLDFKDALPGGDDKGKVDFLKDVTALANTDGGDLIYGLLEERENGQKTGIAGEVVGIDNVNFDERRLWMGNLVRDNTEPRVMGVAYHAVPVDDRRTALVVRVPRSWNGPHAVSYAKHWRFYGRNAAGNYPMDVQQLREAVLASSAVPEKLENFRADRLRALKSKHASGQAAIALHIQPFESARPGFAVDLSVARRTSEYFAPGWSFEAPNVRYNFDGLIAFNNGAYTGHVQLFRSGAIEEEDVFLLKEKTADGQKVIVSVELERFLFKAVGRRLSMLRALGISSPVMIGLSLFNVRDYKLQARVQHMMGGPSSFNKLFDNPIDRDDLVIPGELIENLQDLRLDGVFSTTPSGQDIYESWKTAELLARPLLDTIWNSVGVERCLHYDPEGMWKGQIERRA